MTAFYKCYKRTHEVNDPDAPVYRAIQYSKDRHEEIMKLCDTLERDYAVDKFEDGFWIIESPFDKWPDGNIVYLINDGRRSEIHRFENTFTPVTVDPGFCQAGRT